MNGTDRLSISCIAQRVKRNSSRIVWASRGPNRAKPPSGEKASSAGPRCGRHGGAHWRMQEPQNNTASWAPRKQYRDGSQVCGRSPGVVSIHNRMSHRRLLVLLVILSLFDTSSAKRRNNKGGRNVASAKRECERGECANSHEDDRENCVLRCQSASCYEQIYGTEELEPGEVDRERSRKFNNCLAVENRKGTRGKPVPQASKPGEAPEMESHSNPQKKKDEF